jgi:hypothetical protein
VIQWPVLAPILSQNQVTIAAGAAPLYLSEIEHCEFLISPAAPALQRTASPGSLVPGHNPLADPQMHHPVAMQVSNPTLGLDRPVYPSCDAERRQCLGDRLAACAK